MVLLCYSYHLGLLCVRTAQIHLSYTCGTTCNPQKWGTQNDGVEKNASCFLNTYTQYPCIISAERFFAFYVYKVDYGSNYVIVITFTSYKRFLSPISLKSSPSQGRLQKRVTPRKTDADCCVDQTRFFFHTHTMYCCLHCPIRIHIYIYVYVYMYILQHQKNVCSDIEDFGETHLCKLRGILRLRVPLNLSDIIKNVSPSILYQPINAAVTLHGLYPTFC